MSVLQDGHRHRRDALLGLHFNVELNGGHGLDIPGGRSFHDGPGGSFMSRSVIATPSARATQAPVCIAHRGASGLEPENTLRAFARAIEQGATWLELDVQRLGDHLVVLHDDTVDRTTDGTGHLQDFTFAQLRALDAGGGERIPLLQEVLDLVAGRARIQVELKGEGTAAPTIEHLGRALASGNWPADSFVLSSFAWDRLLAARALAPDLPVAPLISGSVTPEALASAVRLGADAIHVGKWAAQAGAVRDAHSRGLMLRVFTVNERWEFELMRRIGVDAVFTDHPARVLAWSQEREWRGGPNALDHSPLSMA
jgi:glycerophosphoryl diester phosphodiesterase